MENLCAAASINRTLLGYRYPFLTMSEIFEGLLCVTCRQLP
jgi:hypothetical protein